MNGIIPTPPILPRPNLLWAGGGLCRKYDGWRIYHESCQSRILHRIPTDNRAIRGRWLFAIGRGDSPGSAI